jgi:hypothetical protein
MPKATVSKRTAENTMCYGLAAHKVALIGYVAS